MFELSYLFGGTGSNPVPDGQTFCSRAQVRVSTSLWVVAITFSLSCTGGPTLWEVYTGTIANLSFDWPLRETERAPVFLLNREALAHFYLSTPIKRNSFKLQIDNKTHLSELCGLKMESNQGHGRRLSLH